MTRSDTNELRDGAPPSHRAFARLELDGRLFAIRPRHATTNFGMSGDYVSETFGLTDAYLYVVQLHDFPATDGWRDGSPHPVPTLLAGSSQLYDLRHSWSTRVRTPFDNVHFNLPRALLDALADELGQREIEFDAPPFNTALDPTMEHLARALLPAFERPHEVNALFLDHVLAAAALHATARFGAADVQLPSGGLAPWQERRAREMMLDALAHGIGITALANACGLSPRHFARAFRQSVGLPPHQWLLHQRVKRAQELLLRTDEPLTGIAINCGFADQSHLTRVFSKAMGVSPRAWRRLRRSETVD